MSKHCCAKQRSSKRILVCAFDDCLMLTLIPFCEASPTLLEHPCTRMFVYHHVVLKARHLSKQENKTDIHV
ncbi:hypothetical protein Hanom_Chr07g00590631 [Helianthus anomalus]